MSNADDVRVIKSLKRLPYSVNGNPRWRVTFTDGSMLNTATDAQIGYTLQNSEFEGTPLVVTLRHGCIIGLEPVHE